jgi:hypothetical protein
MINCLDVHTVRHVHEHSLLKPTFCAKCFTLNHIIIFTLTRFDIRSCNLQGGKNRVRLKFLKIESMEAETRRSDNGYVI